MFFIRALVGFVTVVLVSLGVHFIIGIDDPLSSKVIVRGLATWLIYLAYFLGISYKRGEI